MTDRELLELAAKAAGKEIHAANQKRRDDAGYGDAGLFIVNGSTCWNPLNDDGDALRLAVKLGLIVEAGLCWHSKHGPAFGEDLLAGEMAATRRAIVRAAAEIGRKTK